MTCQQCGHENPPSSRYCNQCGAAQERRRIPWPPADARPEHGPEPSIAPGDENSQRLRPTPREASRAELTSARVGVSRRPHEPLPVEDDRTRGPAYSPRSDTHVSGPSFLGLGGPAEPAGSDYLLEEDRGGGGGLRKFVLLLILLLVGALFWMQWRSNTRAESPPPATEQGQAPQDPSAQPTPPADSGAGMADPNAIPESHGGATAAPPAETPAESKPEEAKPDETKPEESKPPESKPESNRPQAAAPQKEPEPEEPAAAAEPTQSPPAARASRQEPRLEPERGSDVIDHIGATPGDSMLYMAQKYLYGRGVPRDCDQALVYLREAAKQPNPRARSQMAALHATGQCVPLDRVLAYQWFSSALALDRANQNIEQQRASLWRQMSSDERQRAVR